ncbi:hypothetical protein TRIATDRAFT_316728 [Trichoderma atroviride IMI 206040]|uniref:Uncharacterized protein n=1 Tax=Hypocrea atroviridis (strain ATCC 20476 / IMI 206040) TaxID=452589 RepID=G9NNR2_HYPAI|nr:uncharacterized protein TRIATDRAFT_316728 [Trichoderma atroviride IMI 206040]EHK47703.1 hypothetical protein TRIATDRAFT_316728 [Trichoderma atroviride IMI 206040]
MEAMADIWQRKGTVACVLIRQDDLKKFETRFVPGEASAAQYEYEREDYMTHAAPYKPGSVSLTPYMRYFALA